MIVVSMGLSRFRGFIFLAFTLSFLVTASLIIFFALGYRYSLERGVFVYSGSITISSLPKTVDLEIDDKPVSADHYGILNETIHVTGLMPGEHTLTISAPGYSPWSKKVNIQSGVSSEYWNVILTRTDYPGVTLADTAGTTRIYPHPDSDLFALAKEHFNETSVVLYDRNTQSGREVFARNGTAFDFDAGENFEWSPNGKTILLPLLENGQRSYFLVATDGGTVEKLSDIVPGLVPTHVRWNSTDDEALLFLAQDSLYRFEITGSRTPVLLAQHIRAYEIADDFIYVMHSETGVISRFRNASNGENQTEITQPISTDFGAYPIVLDVYDEERMALLEQGGHKRLFAYNRAPRKNYGFQEIATGVESFQFSNDGKKLLFSSTNEIGVYFTREWDVQPRRAENETLQIARFSEPIANVSWSEDYEHILFTRGSTLKVVELDGRSGRMSSDIKSFVADPSQIFPLFSQNRLYIVVPGMDIDSIVFPEPQGLFGD
ncbi:MAG: PEGA domain-containing protein [Candidatus Moraniibacteriota bacterium]|nr:MAG: PEGA domain-containing protein [Candidatus Moranbacteria bacterium]